MSSEIKNTIALLCKLINLVYGTNLKPEYFRLAKFNSSEENIVPILWTTLYSILDEDSISTIQRRFRCLNYTREEFYLLGTETNHPSRELLLALAFLITVTLEKDLQKKLDVGPFPYIFGPSNESQVVKSHQAFNWNKLKKDELQNYGKWLRGRISLNSSKILEYEEQIHKIQEKYGKTLDLKAHSALTVYEILALKNKKIGDQFLQDTEPFVHLMSAYTKWVQKEKQFWKWMGTVLEEAKRVVHN